MRLRDVKHGEEGKEYAEKTDVGHDDADMDEYGFVIHRDSVALASGFVGLFYSINTLLVIRSQVDSKNLLDKLSCLLKEQLLEPALNLTVHCCGREFRVLNGYDHKSFDEERGLK
ncbi:hypothetical protein Tco_0255605 [Tanacetum coccineum]